MWVGEYISASPATQRALTAAHTFTCSLCPHYPGGQLQDALPSPMPCYP